MDVIAGSGGRLPIGTFEHHPGRLDIGDQDVDEAAPQGREDGLALVRGPLTPATTRGTRRSWLSGIPITRRFRLSSGTPAGVEELQQHLAAGAEPPVPHHLGGRQVPPLHQRDVGRHGADPDDRHVQPAEELRRLSDGRVARMFRRGPASVTKAGARNCTARPPRIRATSWASRVVSMLSSRTASPPIICTTVRFGQVRRLERERHLLERLAPRHAERHPVAQEALQVLADLSTDASPRALEALRGGVARMTSRSLNRAAKVWARPCELPIGSRMRISTTPARFARSSARETVGRESPVARAISCCVSPARSTYG